jgi:hypothetical protein
MASIATSLSYSVRTCDGLGRNSNTLRVRRVINNLARNSQQLDAEAISPSRARRRFCNSPPIVVGAPCYAKLETVLEGGGAWRVIAAKRPAINPTAPSLQLREAACRSLDALYINITSLAWGRFLARKQSGCPPQAGAKSAENRGVLIHGKRHHQRSSDDVC